jgi:hypothetical protein
MAIDRHDVIFQSIGSLLALAVAFGGAILGVHLFGRYGVLALVVAVPVAVIGGWLIIKILHFAKRTLSD